MKSFFQGIAFTFVLTVGIAAGTMIAEKQSINPLKCDSNPRADCIYYNVHNILGNTIRTIVSPPRFLDPLSKELAPLILLITLPSCMAVNATAFYGGKYLMYLLLKNRKRR